MTVSGTLSKLDRFSSAYVTLSLNLGGYGEGTYTLPLVMRLDERVNDLSVQLVQESVKVTVLNYEKEEQQEESTEAEEAEQNE